jgi:Cu+-exporting ATPase
MDRRDFIRGVAAAAGAAAGVPLAAATAREMRSVRYGVDGFTCVTCAVGLETMLRPNVA